jgi:flagellar biosynthesis protein FlhF
MLLVRRELGDDAIIVSTQRAANGKGVRITAALEPDDREDNVTDIIAAAGRAPIIEQVRDALAEHGVPTRLADRLVNAVRIGDAASPLLALVAALESGFSFAPLPDYGAPQPFMLVGPPGVGKSMAIAKLAARSALKGRRVGVVTCDNLRAGATEQLAAFTRILEIDLVTARGPDSLARAIQGIAGRHDIVFIDSPGLNPFKATDLEYLAALIEASNVEPILVLAAGADPLEAQEIGEAFGEVGATRLLATRLDTTRRLGSIIAAADAGPLMFSDVSSTPHVVNGVTPFTSASLARIILPQALPESAATPSTELPNEPPSRSEAKS